MYRTTTDVAPMGPFQVAVSPVRNPSRHLLARRLLNVLVAVVGIVITLPLMILIGMLVRLTSPGPAIHKQERIGLDRRRLTCPLGFPPAWDRRRHDLGGRPFTIFKFRTMTVDSGQEQRWASAGDPRITRLGRFLRAHRLDELPQLFNVVRGEMNVVGPRPEQPRIFSDLAEQVRGYRTRQRVLPGITGLAQVTLPYDQSIESVRAKVARDLQYVRQGTLLTDVAVMGRTVFVMLSRRGAR